MKIKRFEKWLSNKTICTYHPFIDRDIYHRGLARKTLNLGLPILVKTNRFHNIIVGLIYILPFSPLVAIIPLLIFKSYVNDGNFHPTTLLNILLCISMFLFAIVCIINGIKKMIIIEEIYIDSDFVKFKKKSIFKNNFLREPINNYEGIISIPISYLNDPTKIIVLLHKDIYKSIALYREFYKGPDPKKQLMYFSNLLNRPILELSGLDFNKCIGLCQKN